MCFSDPNTVAGRGTVSRAQSGLLFKTQKWIVWGDTRADKTRDLIGKGHLGREEEGKGTQENYSASWLTVLGFVVMGLVSGFRWPIILTQGPSWWHTHRSTKMDFSKNDSGRSLGHTDWHLLSPFDLSQILPVGGSLLVLRSLPRPPVVR